MRYFDVSDSDFPLVSCEHGIATYRAPEGLHPRACMLWAAGKVRGVAVRVRVIGADGRLVAECA
jgi:hypothetical protein